MIPGSLAKRYARALMLMAETPIQREAFGRGLNGFNEALKIDDGQGTTMMVILASERYLPSERRGVLQSVCRRLGVESNVMAFLTYVLDRGRIAGIPQITRFFNEIADEMAGRVQATIRAAMPLAPDAERKIQLALERATGKKVVAETHVDPDLLGGVVAQVGSTVVDGSLRTQLEQLRTNLGG